MLEAHAHRPDLLAQVQAAYVAPSLYDEALRLLARRGLAVPASHTARDWTRGYEENDAVEQAWLVVYRNPKAYFDLYQLGEELTDLEDAFRLWRFRHVTPVERILGFKRGTGGGLPAQDAGRGAVSGDLEVAHRFISKKCLQPRIYLVKQLLF